MICFIRRWFIYPALLAWMIGFFGAASAFYIAGDGGATGPFTDAELRQQVQTGLLTRDTLVWKEGMPEWVRAGDVPELRGYLEQPLSIGIQVYVANQGQTTGPFALAELRAKVAAGEIDRDTLVWEAGMQDWAPLHTVANKWGIQIAAGATPPQPRTETQQRDWKTYLAGEWRVDPFQQPVAGYGLADIVASTVYDLNGTYLTWATMQVNGPQGHIMFRINSEGTWEVSQVAGGKIKLSIQGQRVMNGPPEMGMPPDVTAINDSALYEMLDENTLRSVERGTISRRVSR